MNRQFFQLEIFYRYCKKGPGRFMLAARMKLIILSSLKVFSRPS